MHYVFIYQNTVNLTHFIPTTTVVVPIVTLSNQLLYSTVVVVDHSIPISSSSSQYCAGHRLPALIRTLGDLEWEVESTTVTHSSADWWDLLLLLA